MTTFDRYRPANVTERNMIRECEQIAAMHGAEVAEVLADAARYWMGSGRSAHPRQWRSRVTAAERLIARGRAIAEFATAGLDPFAEVSGFGTMTAEEYAAAVTYLSDYQG